MPITGRAGAGNDAIWSPPEPGLIVYWKRPCYVRRMDNNFSNQK